MPHQPIPTSYYAFVIIQKDNKFLLIQECRYQQPWYIPGGKVEFNENILEAAKRETQEEAGIPINLDGILQIEHTTLPNQKAIRLRIIFVAHPQDNTPPKTNPNQHSLNARWFTLQEINQLPLREKNLTQLCQNLSQGQQIYPLEILTFKTQPDNL
jgi:ADP-ribose pyrophosphatase YjhB (NUDIX family)